MKNKKAYQKNQLFYEFGILMQPLEDLARAEQPSSLSDYRTAIAKVQAGDGAWRQQVEQFATFASDIFYGYENQEISHVPERCLSDLQESINNPIIQNDSDQLKVEAERVVKNALNKFTEYTDRIPIEWEPVVFKANTPFTSYLRIKESIVSVKKRLHYLDRYLKPDFFELFLASVENTVEIRLVTTSGKSSKKYGVAAVTAMSKLAQKQFADYQLIEVDPKVFHDRNLRIDDQIFTLGSGVDCAGIRLTNFGPSDSSPKTHNEFDQIIAAGTVIQ